jgi:hypothetical protein
MLVFSGVNDTECPFPKHLQVNVMLVENMDAINAGCVVSDPHGATFDGPCRALSNGSKSAVQEEYEVPDQVCTARAAWARLASVYLIGPRSASLILCDPPSPNFASAEPKFGAGESRY